MSSKGTDTTIRGTARKKAVRHVPSRYRQAAQGVKCSVGSTTSSSLPSINETLEVSQAPWNDQGDNSSGIRNTSTPNSSGAGPIISVHDASVISFSVPYSAPPLKEHLIVPSVKKQKAKSHSDQLNLRPTQHAVPVVAVSKTAKEKLGMKVSGPDHIQEIEVKNLYALHVQAAYLESRARKCLQIRSQNALEQFYKIYCVIQIFMGKIKTAESDLIVLGHLQQLQEFLEPQEEILEVVTKDMPTMLEHYHEISRAVDSVRSNLPLSDIHISPDSNLKADLACLLTKCETQIEGLFKCHSSEMMESARLSQLLLEIKNSIGDLEKETYRLNDLLLAVDEMTITESFLKIGEIMSVTAKNLII